MPEFVSSQRSYSERLRTKSRGKNLIHAYLKESPQDLKDKLCSNRYIKNACITSHAETSFVRGKTKHSVVVSRQTALSSFPVGEN